MMISRRNFAMLTAIMLVVLFMFQATGIAKNRLNHAQTNEYALENRTDMQSENAFSPDAQIAGCCLWLTKRQAVWLRLSVSGVPTASADWSWWRMWRTVRLI